ncbi:MAG: DUF5688 family protein [Lachnospiraceae bacterium]|nr:DUF5688 family protein [Lachnospiraceae bacterium]
MTDIIEFDRFTDEVRKAVSDRYPESCVELRRVTKNNGVIYTGLTVRNEDERIYPTMYLEGFYEESDEGRISDELIDRICGIYESRRVPDAALPGVLGDYDSIRGNLRCRLINRAANEEYLKDVVSRDFLDLAIVPYYLFDEGALSFDRGADASFVIRRSNLDVWGVCEDKVLDDSISNTLGRDDICISGIYDVLRRLNPAFAVPDEETAGACPMYVMTNGTSGGAISMIDCGRLDEFCDSIGSDIYVIPSSISEVILVPRDDTAGEEMFDSMISEINETQLDAVDVLSDHVYCFSRGKGYIERDSY